MGSARALVEGDRGRRDHAARVVARMARRVRIHILRRKLDRSFDDEFRPDADGRRLRYGYAVRGDPGGLPGDLRGGDGETYAQIRLVGVSLRARRLGGDRMAAPDRNRRDVERAGRLTSLAFQDRQPVALWRR